MREVLRLRGVAVSRLARPAAWALLLFGALWLGPRVIPAAPLAARFSTSTAVYDADGRLLRLTLSADEKYRVWVPLARISPTLIEATLLHEDRHFRWHPGVNPLALVRGAWRTYGGTGPRQGGSTITMQLARLVFGVRSSSVPGKMAQIARALQLELCYTKDEILEAYLNLVPYGGNVEGAAAASLIYFGRDPARITVPEALTLAVLPQSPTRRRPAEAAGPELRAARDRLYARWRAAHAPAEGEAEMMALPLRMGTPSALPFRAPHLVDALLARHAGSGEIHSTLDRRLQDVVERQIRGYVTRQRRIGITNAAAILVDAQTMEVKAFVGSANFFEADIQGQVNGVFAQRSPGSTLKPFIYALAVDQGLLHPLTVLKDAPTAFGPYSPENFDGRFAGPVTAKEALIRSRNVPAVAVAARLANPDLYEFLRMAGVSDLRSRDYYGLALVLGGGEVSLEELTTLYATLANRGELKHLRYTREDPAGAAVRLLSDEASFMVLDMLKDTPRPDQAPASRSPLPVSWKTGTSYGFRDAWTMGVVGPYVLGVWVGNFDGSGNPAFVGVQAAAPLFFQMVDAIEAQDPSLTEPLRLRPKRLSRVEVCAASGDLPNDACPRRASTWFIPGVSPIRVSTLHRAVMIDDRSGLRACPPFTGGRTHAEVYEFWPSDMLALFRQAGLPRRTPPPFDARCRGGSAEESAADAGPAPEITSPLRGVTYSMRVGTLGRETIPLRAVTGAEVREVYWFVDEEFVGKALGGAALDWAPKRPGSHMVRAVDDLGQAAARALEVAVVR